MTVRLSTGSPALPVHAGVPTWIRARERNSMAILPPLSELNALSAVDGRYRDKTAQLADYLSEKALIEARLKVEAHWLLHLADQLPPGDGFKLTTSARQLLENLLQQMPADAASQVKQIETETNHDVKACEYYIRSKLQESQAEEKTLAFIHFACTSEDINNLSYALMLHGARRHVLLPSLEKIQSDLKAKAKAYKNLPMLSHTHGQTATPTTLGKEFCVFAHRIQRYKEQLETLKLQGKMNGAVGNYNAHCVAYPQVNWPEFTKSFIEEKLGLHQNPLTTQIENHDSMIDFLETLRRINAILIGLSRDIWTYISMGYFKQKTVAGEVGSSTMPHKVNPIDFENAEGNFGIANGLISHLSEKLPISRLQRDLSDSTVQRTIGTVVGHIIIAHKALLKGLGKITPQDEVMSSKLDQAIEVLAEPIQTVLRKHGAFDAYERLKAATRGQAITKKALDDLIDASPELPDSEKKHLKSLRPSDYTGMAAHLVDQFLLR